MAYPGGFGVDTTGIDFGDTFLPGAGSPTYGTYDFLPRSQFPEESISYNFYDAQSNPGGGFFNKFGQFVNQAGQFITPIGKLVGAVGDIARIGSQGDSGIFNPNVLRESTQKIKEEQYKTFGDIQKVFGDIGGLTGVSTATAVEEFKNKFKPEIDKLTKEGIAGLREAPDISKQYATAVSRITEARDLNSLLNNPRFAAAYKAADAVAPVDTNAIKNVMTLGPAYKEQYSYEDPESQRNIYGRRNAIGDIASFYANDPNLNQYMVSATDPNIQNLMNYS